MNETFPKKTETLAGRCFQDIENECKRADTRIAKILRLDLQTSTKLFRNLPKLKIAILYRDPRAIINSRIKTEWFPVQENNTDEVTSNINSLCVKMENDLEALENIESTVRDKIAVIKAEDLFATNTGVLDVFKFINKNITATEFGRIDAVITGKTLFRDWRKEMRTEYQTQTKSKCKTVLGLYGVK